MYRRKCCHSPNRWRRRLKEAQRWYVLLFLCIYTLPPFGTAVGLLCSCNSVCSCVGHSDLNWCVSGKFEVKVLVHFFLTPKEFKCVCLCVNDVRMDEKLFHCPQVQHLLSEWIERLLRGRFKKSQKSLDPNFKSDSSNAFTLFFLICFIKKKPQSILMWESSTT